MRIAIASLFLFVAGLAYGQTTIYAKKQGVHHFDVEAVGGGNIGTQTAGIAFNIQITAKDASNNTVTSYNGTPAVTSTGALSVGEGTTPAFTDGVLASHSITITNTGSFTITVTRAGGPENGTSNSFTVNPGAINNFLVEAAGGGSIGTQTAGTSFNIKLTARDALNNTVTGFTSTAVITSTGTLSAGNGTTASFTSGVLSSHAVTISNTGSFTITATKTAGSEAGTSNSFTVNPGVLSAFTVTATGGGSIPAQATSTPFNIKVTAKDANSNTVTSFTGTVSITSTGTLSAGGGTSPAFTAGVLSSHSVTISNAGTWTITATKTAGSENGTSNSFAVGTPERTAYVQHKDTFFLYTQKTLDVSIVKVPKSRTIGYASRAFKNADAESTSVHMVMLNDSTVRVSLTDGPDHDSVLVRVHMATDSGMTALWFSDSIVFGASARQFALSPKINFGHTAPFGLSWMQGSITNADNLTIWLNNDSTATVSIPANNAQHTIYFAGVMFGYDSMTVHADSVTSSATDIRGAIGETFPTDKGFMISYLRQSGATSGQRLGLNNTIVATRDSGKIDRSLGSSGTFMRYYCKFTDGSYVKTANVSFGSSTLALTGTFNGIPSGDLPFLFPMGNGVALCSGKNSGGADRSPWTYIIGVTDSTAHLRRKDNATITMDSQIRGIVFGGYK